MEVGAVATLVIGTVGVLLAPALVWSPRATRLLDRIRNTYANGNK